MALKQIYHGSKEYQQMIDLRKEILRKPLGLSFTEEELASEKNDILIGAFDDDTILACCLLTKMAAIFDLENIFFCTEATKKFRAR